MDPLRLIIAFFPIAAYMMLLGILNLRRRPVVIGGARDGLLLGLALFGLAMIGPMELLLPESTAFRFGGYAWLMLAGFYLLSLALMIMVGRPHLVIYNSDLETVRPALSHVARCMDEQSRWAGDSVVMPTIGIQLYMERYSLLRNVQLRATDLEQPHGAWLMLESELRKELKQVRCERSACGSMFLVLAIGILSTLVMRYLGDQGDLARCLDDMLRR